MRAGRGEGARKFLIFLEGGGFCGSHDACLERAGSYLGSTAYDADPPGKYAQWFRELLEHPFAKPAQSENPLLWNWNHVFVRTCDGAYFASDRVDPITVNGRQLYYRGQHILDAVMKDLATRQNLQGASEVVLSGCSAGGITLFAQADSLASRLPGSPRVVAFADSGFYLDTPLYTPLKRFVVQLDGANATAVLNQECVSENPGEEERCFVGAVAATYLRTPLFAWQSRYDTDQRGCEMTPECAANTSCVEEYGQRLTWHLHTALLSNPVHGAFVDSCNRHCAGPALPRDSNVGATPMQAFAAWYRGGARVYRQSAPYPCPGCCAAGNMRR